MSTTETANASWRKARADQLASITERRTLACEEFDLRASDTDPDTLHFRGYASVTESPYDMGWNTETVGRGAFKKTLASNPDVVLNLGHGTNGSGLPIARTKAGTLRLTEDHKGLKVDADLDRKDADVQLLEQKYNHGDLDGQMSFAFRVERQEWNDDYTKRRITEVNIHRGDVSIVTQGANPATSSALRSFELGQQARQFAYDRETEYRIRLLRIQAPLPRRHIVEDEYDRRIRALRLPSRSRRADAKPVCPRCRGKKTVAPNGVDIRCPLCLGAGVFDNSTEGDDPGETTPTLSYGTDYSKRLRRAAEKYTQKQIDALGRKGKAFKNPDGHFSFPIADAEDLADAVKAVGRSGASHNAVRKFIILRARLMMLSSKIPSNWNPVGSIKK